MRQLPWLDDDTDFPPVETALRDPEGLLAAGGRLDAETLQRAYRRGIFPWYSPGQPVLWWSPDPRTVLFPAQLKLSRSLRKRIRNGGLEVSLDEDFPAVIAACAASRPERPETWITPDIVRAYSALFTQGLAHSVEVRQDGELVGGLYGVALGRAFFGESMFSLRSDASKVGLAWLVTQLRRWGCQLIDCQMHTPHLVSLGARELPRARFLTLLEDARQLPGMPAPWRFDPDHDPLAPCA